MVIKHPVDSKTAQNFIDNDYYDRGMLKWRGFMLSDHTEYLQREKQKISVKFRNQQPFNEINNIIRQSVELHRQIIVQVNYLTDNHPVEITGNVKGVQENRLFIHTHYKVHSFELEMIRNIRLK